jgi:hypothetical protein
MRAIIEAEGVKRQITGPFAIYLTKADRLAIIAALELVVDSVLEGWIDVVDLPKRVPGLRPIGWTEGADS